VLFGKKVQTEEFEAAAIPHLADLSRSAVHLVVFFCYILDCIVQNRIWQTLSPHPETFSEADRRLYAKSYAQEGAMRAAFEMFKDFNNQDATDNRKFAVTKLPMPVKTIEGDKAMGGALEIQAKIGANNVTSIIFRDTGHWLMEQRPAETKAELKKFFDN